MSEKETKQNTAPTMQDWIALFAAFETRIQEEGLDEEKKNKLIGQRNGVYGEILQKLKNMPLFVLAGPVTGIPWTDADGRIEIFSDEQFAEEARDYFLQQQVVLRVEKIPERENEKFFREWLMGAKVQGVVIDNGKRFLCVPAQDLLG